MGYLSLRYNGIHVITPPSSVQLERVVPVHAGILSLDMTLVAPTIPIISIGGGRIVARCHGSEVVFSELSSTYPLKLLSPRIQQDGVALVYILSYGGGLVGGDRVNLSVDVGFGTTLVLLSQVSGYHMKYGIPVMTFLIGLDESVQNAIR
jgi:hypothetical protein